jgi:hypothetical protein
MKHARPLSPAERDRAVARLRTMTVGANSPVVVTDTEAIIVDSQITAAAARAMVQDIKAITDKPIRYVIDRSADDGPTVTVRADPLTSTSHCSAHASTGGS